jgi:hypothetical protein
MNPTESIPRLRRLGTQTAALVALTFAVSAGPIAFVLYAVTVQGPVVTAWFATPR